MSQLEKAIERAQIGLGELSADGLFLSVNSAYLTMLGVSEADLVGRHWRNTVHPDDHSQVDEAYETARTNGRGYAEVRALRNDSGILYHAITITAVTDANGEF